MRGWVDRSQVRHLKQHELDTAHRVADLGHEVAFLPRAETRTADVLIDGTEWELKSPIGTSTSSIVQALRHGRKQARRVVVDLDRSPVSWEEARVAINTALTRYDELVEVFVLRGSARMRIGGE